MHLILNTNFNNAFKITLFDMPGGAFFMCSLPLTLEPGYATGLTTLCTEIGLDRAEFHVHAFQNENEYYKLQATQII